MDGERDVRFRWGHFELWPEQRRLLRDGAPVNLEPKVMDLLIELVRGGRRARARDELLDKVWASQVVEDQALSQAVSRLRAALDDRSGQVVETLRGRGYRFNIDVSDVTPDPAPVPRRASAVPSIAVALAIAVIAGLAALLLIPDGTAEAEGQRVAVMSFDTEDEAIEWIRLGLSAIVADALPAHHDVDVVPSRTSFELTDAAGDREAHAFLQRATGADYVLDADVRRVDVGWSLSYRLWREDEIVWEETVTGAQLRQLVDQLNVSLADRLDAPRRERMLPTRLSTTDFVNELFARGRQARFEGDFKGAAELFRLCLKEDPSLHAARSELADVLRRLGDYEEATALAQDARAAALASGDADLSGDALTTLGLIAWRQGDYDTGIERIREALVLHEAEGRVADAAFDRNVLAILVGRRGEHEQAIDLYMQALSSYRSIGDRAGEAKTLNNLGWHAWNRGEHQVSLDYDVRALAIQEELGLTSDIALSLNNLGAGYQRIGRIEEAHGYLVRSLEIRERGGDRAGMVTTLGNLGLIAGWRGQFERGLDYLDRAIELARELGAPELEAHAQLKAGDLRMKSGDHAGARAAFDAADELWRALAIDSAIKETALWRAELAVAEGDAASASGLLPDPDTVEDEAQRALIHHLRGQVDELRGEPESAFSSYRDAITNARAVGAFFIVVRAAIAAAHLCIDSGGGCAEEFLAHTGAWQDEYAPAAIVHGRWLLAEGRSDLAAAELRRARELAPGHWTEEHERWLQAATSSRGSISALLE